MSLKGYIAIARPDHWTKNVFVLPGTLVAALLGDVPLRVYLPGLIVGLVSVCLVASANYVINEWLDAIYDKFHPTKRLRPAVSGDLKRPLVYTEYALLAIVGTALGFCVSVPFGLTSILLLVMGVLYNVEPVRTKDRAILDVLSESFNNPIRLALGWFVVTADTLPPSSLVISYWMGGAFLMAIKRFAEYRRIGDGAAAGSYRRSFRYYTEEKLLISAFFYAMSCGLVLGVFLVKYRIELLLLLPFVAVLFAWYFHMAFQPDSPVQYPEKLHQERSFLLYTGFVGALFVALLLVDVPALRWLLGKAFLAGP